MEMLIICIDFSNSDFRNPDGTVCLHIVGKYLRDMASHLGEVIAQDRDGNLCLSETVRLRDDSGNPVGFALCS